MKKGFQRLACIFVAVAMAAALPACKKKDKKETYEPSFPIKSYADADYNFSIPDEWGQLADPSGSGVLVFAGKEAYEEPGFNNVSVCIYDTDSKAPSMEDVEAAFQEGFEAKVKESHPEATDFAYGTFNASQYPVFTAEYRVSLMGKDLTQRIYYPLVDNKQIYVAACDTGGEGISADEAAKEIVHSFYVTSAANEEASKEE